MATTRSSIRPARPTIEIAGRDEPALAGGLLALSVVETAQGLYRCEARFGNWGAKGSGVGLLYLDRRTLDFGKAIVIKLGGEPVFQGRITAIAGLFPEGAPPEVEVYAEDRLQDLRMTRRTRTWSDVSDEDIFRRVAQDHGLTPDLAVAGPTHAVLAQLNQSDLAFLRDRARATGVELWVAGSTLHAKTRMGRAGKPIHLSYGTDLYDATVLADLAEQRSAVVVSGWDPGSKQVISERADAAALGSEAADGDTGASLLARARLGERVEPMVHRVPLSADEARRWAEAHYRARARGFVVLRGRAAADARLRVGAAVEVVGLGDMFNGKYALTEVRHVFDDTGVFTEIVGERPKLGRTPQETA